MPIFFSSSASRTLILLVQVLTGSELGSEKQPWWGSWMGVKLDFPWAQGSRTPSPHLSLLRGTSIGQEGWQWPFSAPLTELPRNNAGCRTFPAWPASSCAVPSTEVMTRGDQGYPLTLTWAVTLGILEAG